MAARFAIFVRRWTGAGFGRARYLGHVTIGGFPMQGGLSTVERARRAGRAEWGRRIVRSCDRVEAERDSARRRWYGTGAPGAWGGGLR